MPQTTVTRHTAQGMPGEIAYGGGESVQTRQIFGVGGGDGSIGVAYTEDGGNTAVQGGTGAFAGILIAPKSYDNRGGVTNTNYAVPSGSPGQLYRSGLGGVWVNLESTSASIGDQVAFSTATGTLVNAAPGAAAPSGHVLIPHAKVDYLDVTGANPTLAVIKILGV